MRRRAVVIQMARLGDLIQTLPAIEALGQASPQTDFDLLCAAPLSDLARMGFPIRQVVPWDGARWREWSGAWRHAGSGILPTVEEYLRGLSPADYDEAFVLNQHGRAVLAGHLLAQRVIGAGEGGPLADDLAPWTGYLRKIARDRDRNRVHLADAFCGLCGVRPTGRAPRLRGPSMTLPGDLDEIGSTEGLWVAVVVGAGHRARCIPCPVWSDWINRFLSAQPDARIVLTGSGPERETAQAIQHGLSPLLLGRVWDATGRTDLAHLMAILSRVAWVIGADTGPLHLGSALGARALGWYFARARVHETGPYGQGHRVFQHRGEALPHSWPIEESIDVLLNGRSMRAKHWDLFESGIDEWGAYFVDRTQEDHAARREMIWRGLSPTLSAMATP